MRKVATAFWLGVAACSGEDDTKDPGTAPTDPTGTTETTPTTADTTPTVDTSIVTTDTATTTTTPSLPGDPLAVDVTGFTYVTDLSNANWVEPAGLGALITSQLTGVQLFVSPTAYDTATMDLLGAIGQYDAQDLCVETVPFSGATWTDPTFAATAPTLSLVFSGFPVDLTDVAFSGMFRADGSMIAQGAMAGGLDTRTLGEAFGLGTAPGAVCTLVGALGIPCLPCPDGETYCLNVEVTDMVLDQLPGTALVERTTDDITADPYCY